jgi:hypothetical protein
VITHMPFAPEGQNVGRKATIRKFCSTSERCDIVSKHIHPTLRLAEAQ